MKTLCALAVDATAAAVTITVRAVAATVATPETRSRPFMALRSRRGCRWGDVRRRRTPLG